MNKFNSVCIIPARGGSKRIKNKNIKKFFNRPIISYSIMAAKKSKCFDKIIVSTDSLKIAKIAKKYGAEVPFLRDKKFATDKVGLRAAIKNTLNKIIKYIGKPKYVCYITATAPLIRVSDIQEGFKNVKKKNVKISCAITEFDYPIQRALKINKVGRIEMLNPKHRFSHSQNLKKCYHDAGQFYWAKTSAIINNVHTFGNSSFPILIPNYRVVDIDDMSDWERAKITYKYLKKNSV